MMNNVAAMAEARDRAEHSLGEATARRPAAWAAATALVLSLVIAAYWHSFKDIYNGSVSPGSLYSHALIIPVISLFFVWRQRDALAQAPIAPLPLLGYPLLIGGCFMLLIGDFLGFMTFVHFSLLPVLAGISLLCLGAAATRLVWFPIAFLFFMLPMPYSIIDPISFRIKMLATESAVELGQLLTLNLVQDGSFVHLGAGDKLLVGDVCGGMRSLIALLAFGALMAYISKTRWWAKLIILLISPVVAIVANVARIFFLCVVGYVWGSKAATGLVHDASGIGIFALAFVLLFGMEALLRKFAPANAKESSSP